MSEWLAEGAGTPLAGFPVRFALDPTSNGGGWLATSSGTTSAAGVSATTARVGLRLGTTRFVAAVDDLHGDPIPGSPITFTATAGPPPAGTVFTVVNDGHVSASTWGDLRRVGIDPANPAEYGQLLPFLYRGASAAGQTTNLATVTSATAPATFWACDGERCSVAADPSGVLYVSGAFFGGGFGGGGNVYSNGIARVNPTTGALERIAGRTTATAPSPGLALDRAGFDRSPTIGFDAAGNLWVANRSATAALNLVGWIAPDPVTGHVEATGIFNQAGQTSAPAVPAAGAYPPLGSAYLGTPWSLTFTPDGHVIVPDAGTVLPSDSVKIIW